MKPRLANPEPMRRRKRSAPNSKRFRGWRPVTSAARGARRRAQILPARILARTAKLAGGRLT